MSDQDRLEQLLARWDELREQGREVAAEQLCGDSPEMVGELKSRMRELKAMDWLDNANAEESESGPSIGECGAAGNNGRSANVPALLAGRYRMEGLIAEGGFGQVWRATDMALLRAVAVKVTTLNCVDEARRVARLKHPGIISVHDVGNDGAFCFIVFDLVEGENLAQRIRDRRPSWRESAAVVATVAEHLHYAHEQGFVHRDIKPANILLDEKGSPLLADFGIAVTESELRHEVVTSAGTLAYMSPEQLTVGARIDARTDVYSLGVVLYELLTGSLPFREESVAALRQRILSHPPPSVLLGDKDVPTRLERICLKCLAKQAADRYATARDLAHDLRELLETG